MYLIINTAKQNEILTAVYNGHKIFQERLKVEFHESEKLLPMVDKVLKKSKVNLKDLKKILVIAGPGSFTSLRIGIAVANTLAFSLKIPVVSFKTDEFKGVKDLIKKAEKQRGGERAVPFYGQEPNITKPKKKWLQ